MLPGIGDLRRRLASPGVVLEAQHLFSHSDGSPISKGPEFGLAIRFVSEKFQDSFNNSYSGDHYEAGLLINF